MELKKVEKDEILCVVSSRDLKDRAIDITTLNYNSAPARMLFDEIISIARNEGFEIESPMMLSIEAIPFENGSLQVEIRKTDVPYELDPRFSDFSYKEVPGDMLAVNAKSLLNAFLSFASSGDGFTTIRVEKVPSGSPMGNLPPVKAPKDEIIRTKRVFEFKDFDLMCEATKELKYKHLRSSLYKDEEKKLYILLLEFDKYENDYADDVKNDIEALKKVGVEIKLNKVTNAYLEEHCKKLMDDDAIAKLSKA